jgi:hypothetical protein
MAAPKNHAAPLIAALQAVTPGKTNEVVSPYPKGPKNGVGKEIEVASPYPKGPKIDTPSPFPKGPKGSGPKKPGAAPARRRNPWAKGY